jgi:hypothetical protein
MSGICETEEQKREIAECKRKNNSKRGTEIEWWCCFSPVSTAPVCLSVCPSVCRPKLQKGRKLRVSRTAKIKTEQTSLLSEPSSTPFI